MDNYVCKIATLDEVKIREQFLIDTHKEDKMNSINWEITAFDKTPSIPYLIRNFC